MGDGAGGSPERRLGYRPPPRGGWRRVLIIGIIAILSAVMLTALVDLVAGYHAKLRVIDRVTGEYGDAHRRAIPGG